MSRTIHDTCQYCSTSRANQALRSLANAGFQNRGVRSASVSFLPLPLPPLSFFGSRFISRSVKTENPLPRSFFAPKPNGNACYAGYIWNSARNVPSGEERGETDVFAGYIWNPMSTGSIIAPAGISPRRRNLEEAL